MTSDVSMPRGPVAATVGRPGAMRLVLDQIGYALRELWRSRLVLIFTFVLPLVWLMVIGLLAGNDAVDETTGVRVMQFVTPIAAAMGILFATYPPVAMSLAQAREEKILKRLRGTPLPAWSYLLGRIGGVTVFALAAVVVMLTVGVVVFDVEVVGRTLLATVGTLVVGIASLSALGMAVAALSPSTTFAQALSIGSAVILTFLSGMFTLDGSLPEWVDRAGGWFPLRHLSDALQDQFNPFLTGSGWNSGGLAVMAAWGVGAMAVAVYGLRRVRSGHTGEAAATPLHAPEVAAVEASRPGVPALVADQTRWANRAARRDAGWIFFAVVMPAGLYALMASMYGDSGFRPTGRDFSFFFACGMVAYGIGVTAFINMPEAVATARDKGVLKRLRGTPVSSVQYLAGRMLSVLWIAMLTAALIFAAGIWLFGVEISVVGLPVAFIVLLAGTLTLAACGLALAAVTPNARSMAAVGLAVLLPLSFLSDVFVIGTTTPAWMSAVGSFFPLRHFLYGLVYALDPAGVSIGWANLGVLAAWLAAATAVAARRFRWDPSA